MHKGTKSHTELDRPDGNSLKENYQIHDIGQAYFLESIELSDLHVDADEWGLDHRHNTGTVVYDDRMDFKLRDAHTEELAALVDVKTKTSEYWMGRYNKRHHDDYVEQRADHGDVPTVIAMFHVDDDDIVSERYIPILDDERAIAGVEVAPDGNPVVITDESYYRDWSWFRTVIQSELP